MRKRLLAITLLLSTLVLPQFLQITTLAQEQHSNKYKSFFDQKIPSLLEKHNVPGMSVAVVQNNETLHVGGYGIASFDNNKQMSGESLMRIASISKLFTYTALMQQIEQGKVDINKNVNVYLDGFEVYGKHQTQITIEDLMSHTSGFEDSYIGIASKNKEDVPELEEFLKQNIPNSVYKSNTIAAYSNYDAALAGYIVSKTSGMSYEDYVEQNILQPLSMTNSTVREPVEDELFNLLATSYEYVDGAFEPQEFIFDNLRPDGSMSASAVDMAKFMIAHLNGGVYEGNSILNSDTINLMHSQSFTLDSRVSGWAHGFKEQNFNGHRVLMHDGGWESFVSVMILVPNQSLGLFVSMNGGLGNEALKELVPSFNDEVLNIETGNEIRKKTPEPNAEDIGYSKEFEGFYRPSRNPTRTIEKANSLAVTRIKATATGSIYFQGREWAKIDENLYQEIDGTERLAFVKDPESDSIYATTDRSSFVRVGLLDTPQASIFLVGLFAIALALFTVSCLGFYLFLKLTKKDHDKAKSVKNYKKSIYLSYSLGAIFLAGLVLSIGNTSVIYGISPFTNMLLLIGLLFVVSTAISPILFYTVVVESNSTKKRKVLLSTLIIPLIAFAVFIVNWRLLPFYT